MKELINSLKGDKVIWAFIALLALFSFMPVFSASSNLAYMRHGSGNALTYLLKHAVHIFIGFFIIYQVHKIPYHYFRGISMFALPIVWVLLIYTLVKGTVIDGANASRWIQIPFIGISFQTSTLAAIVLYVFVARYLSKSREVEPTLKQSFIDLWIPVFVTLALIFPANFSTAALIFAMVTMLAFIGKYPLRYIGLILGVGLVSALFFVLIAKKFPEAFPNRVDTWISRIDNFMGDKPDEDIYQIEKAKIAIATGGVYGLGPGKSVQKNFLPQSSSDFIFAIIVEEYGLFGAMGILSIYLLLLFRFIIAAHKSNSLFGKLVVVGLGFPIVFQALINMAVAVELLPVTGQTLPLISSGGSSVWMTCIAIGIILSVTKKEEEIAAELEEKQKREEALQRLIDKQLQEDEDEIEEVDENQEKVNQMKSSIKDKIMEEDYSIEENPMLAIKGMRKK
ncbi:FtsW/RodA/SpoVE family cell cycle protein [Flavobacterium aquatile]|uniref:Probable peptidoglycan glycosyltransferase FtsW n=1 Tax=Flavobacterium aquatile LMG 4008 = ATCC 11947 TaxID=1453498 RepID=A0A095U3Y1_9FLAO|nr:FtsW/RodA/SpoVE family cell cycle protein [Flavobacterium aquatile]KGD69308.1 cell division protein FtsW [Flavobacterium aquatile LMG 4008 = ATCC 11947]OXA69559.1 cell division protein FtsW [Flavobacterium aquatile LMG 4008 = ATCC 11947]GEC77735.1 cell division protein FtsW [Flavobacterium aquatile]